MQRRRASIKKPRQKRTKRSRSNGAETTTSNNRPMKTHPAAKISPIHVTHTRKCRYYNDIFLSSRSSRVFFYFIFAFPLLSLFPSLVSAKKKKNPRKKTRSISRVLLTLLESKVLCWIEEPSLRISLGIFVIWLRFLLFFRFLCFLRFPSCLVVFG